MKFYAKKYIEVFKTRGFINKRWLKTYSDGEDHWYIKLNYIPLKGLDKHKFTYKLSIDHGLIIEVNKEDSKFINNLFVDDISWFSFKIACPTCESIEITEYITDVNNGEEIIFVHRIGQNGFHHIDECRVDSSVRD